MADHQQEYAEVVARAWSDDVFRVKLSSDLATALRETGVILPDGITIKVVENTDSLFHLVLPPQPDSDLEDEALDNVLGGALGGYFRGDILFCIMFVVVRAWSDVAFKVKLLSDPATALREMGVTLPYGITMKVVQDTDSLFHLVLPPRPDDLFEGRILDKVVGEGTFHWEGDCRSEVTEERGSHG